MQPIQAIFEVFGGPTKLADALGEPVSTVHAWKGSDAKPGRGIPHWRRRDILDAAVRLDKELPPEALTYLATARAA